jgi:hypothetical protein
MDPPLVWSMLAEIAPRDKITAAMAVVDTLVPDDDWPAERKALTSRYKTVRPFLALLGESPALAAAHGGRQILSAVWTLPRLARRKGASKSPSVKDIDADLVPRSWKLVVFANPTLAAGAVDRDAYVVCVLEQLHRALLRRDVYATPSNRWADPRARLLDVVPWSVPTGVRGLGSRRSCDSAGTVPPTRTRCCGTGWTTSARCAGRVRWASGAPGDTSLGAPDWIIVTLGAGGGGHGAGCVAGQLAGPAPAAAQSQPQDHPT